MSWIRKETEASYNFKAPQVSEDENKILETVFPTQENKGVTLDSNAAEVTVQRSLTIVDLGSEALAAAATLTLTPGSDMQVGDRVLVKWVNGGTKYDVTIKKDASTTIGTLVGVQSKTVTKEVVWNGSTWLIVG